MDYMKVYINSLTPELFLKLYSSVGWTRPGKDHVETALAHTPASFTACDGDTPVGMARLIGDGGMSFYLKDFVVIPSFQSGGVGTLLIGETERYIKDSIRPGLAVSLELISTPGAVSFYKKMGFEERPCEWDGPGMFKMIRASR